MLGAGTLNATTRITPHDGDSGGTFTPTFLYLTDSGRSGTFTYTPASEGTFTISTTNDQSLTDPSSLSVEITHRSTYTLSAPDPNSSLTVVSSGNFTIEVSDTLSKDLVIVPHDDGHHGTFSPSTIALTNASPSATFTYTPKQWGTFRISTTNNSGLIDPPSVEYIGLVRDANEGIHPKITFRVRSAFDFVLESAPLFDRATQTYQLGLTTYYIPEHPMALRPGDTFTLYGVEAIRVKRNHIGVPNSFLEIVSEV
jgi:hypothetical protein